ncbi:HAD family hydrolase [Thermaurantiacus sp.]|uniref:HAD family hydrolase n=1 Tax=Thermaurantiacus sp. TaxID=2820283 RepID=UPI00298EFEAC|nr:HAD family hydrolase [Thermaurantiacus sp.]
MALYDMDGTLTEGASWWPWLLFWVRTEAPWRALLVPVVALLLPLFPLLGRGGLKQAMQRLLMGEVVPCARVAQAARAFAATFGARRERPWMLARMAADRDEGLAIVVATASAHFYAEALAERWGVDALIATENERRGDDIGWRLLGANCFGPEKRRRVEAWLARHGAHVVRCYSDHHADLPILGLAAEPVAVCPTRTLRRLARRRGWPILGSA